MVPVVDATYSIKPNKQGRISVLWLLLVVITCLARIGDAKDSDDHVAELVSFFRACQSGPLSKLQSILKHNPDWVSTRRTATGETCLHLSSLTGQVDTIRWLVQTTEDGDASHAKHLDLDARTRGDTSLRETPLSMSVKNGHVEAARALLEAGASANLEFDSMMGGLHSVTVMDILVMILPKQLPERPSPTLQNYIAMQELLLEYGAQRWSDVQTASEL